MLRCLLAAILFLAVGTTSAGGWIVDGHVVGISDGDTITVLDSEKTQHKIRFVGIDAPEKGQAFGKRSKQSLSALVFQKGVEASCHKKDRYGREVCAVFIGLRRGARADPRGHGLALRAISARAADAGAPCLRAGGGERRVGLWKDAKPMPPWEWRKQPPR